MEEGELVDWSRTRVALTKLMSLFTCTSCRRTLRKPCSFQMCDHYFCTSCAMDLVNNGTNCPACNVVLWREHLQTNLKIPEVMNICERIQNLICKDGVCNEEDVGTNVQNIDKSGDDNLVDKENIVIENIDETEEKRNKNDIHTHKIDIDNNDEGMLCEEEGRDVDVQNIDDDQQCKERNELVDAQNIQNENSVDCNTYVFECPKSAEGKVYLSKKAADVADVVVINDDSEELENMVEINNDSEELENEVSSTSDSVSQDRTHCSISYPEPLEIITHEDQQETNVTETIPVSLFCTKPRNDEITFNDVSDGDILAFPLSNDSNKENVSLVVDPQINIEEEINKICQEDDMPNKRGTSRHEEEQSVFDFCSGTITKSIKFNRKAEGSIDNTVNFVNHGKCVIEGSSDLICNKKDGNNTMTSIKSKGERKGMGMICNLTTDQEERPSTPSPEKSQFSNAVSDLDCVNGAQRNPNTFTKKPKFTYGNKKQRGSSKTSTNNSTSISLLVTSRATTSKEVEQSVFDFSSGTVTKSIQFKKNEESSEEVSVNDVADKTVRTKRKRDEKTSTKKKKENGKGKDCSANENTKKIKENDKQEENETQGKAQKNKTRNLEKKNKKGETALHTACIKGKYERVKELLELGAQANTKDFNGWTPLHEACNYGFVSIVELLLDYNAIIDCVAGEDNDTPLHDAVSNSRIEVARSLLQRGAPKNIKNRSGLLPQDYACTSEMKNVFREMNMFETNDVSVDNQLNMSSVSSLGATFVFITTNLNPLENTEVEKCCNCLGGVLVSEFDTSVTHVICGILDSTNENNISKSRTMKYLLGVLTGKWMVSFNWITDSLKASKWEPEANYELKGSLEAMDEVPQKSRINSFKSLPKLFGGCSFYLSGTFNEKLSKEAVTNLITLGGGKILYREPKTSDLEGAITALSPQNRKLNLNLKVTAPVTIYHAKENSAQVCCREYINYDSNETPGHKKICSPVLCTAPVPWLLDCISNFQILDVQDAYDQLEGYKSSQN